MLRKYNKSIRPGARLDLPEFSSRVTRSGLDNQIRTATCSPSWRPRRGESPSHESAPLIRNKIAPAGTPPPASATQPWRLPRTLAPAPNWFRPHRGGSSTRAKWRAGVTRSCIIWINSPVRSSAPRTWSSCCGIGPQHQGDDPGFQYLTDGERTLLEWTYADVDRKARAIAASLQAMDMEGERALLLYPSGLDFVAAFFGCLYAGVIAVPAYPPRRNRNMARIDAIANDAEAKIALTTFEVLERVQTMIADTPALQRIRWRATDQWDDELADQWQPARRPRRHARVPAIHVRFDRHAQGRDAHPFEPDAQLGDDHLRLRAFALGQRVLLAAAVSRHGAHRRHPAAAVHGPAQHAAVADALPAEARALAAGHLAVGLARSAAGRTSPTTCAPRRSPPSRSARSTSAAGRWRSTAPSRCGPRRSTASPRRSPSAASAARRSTPATAWPRRR